MILPIVPLFASLCSLILPIVPPTPIDDSLTPRRDPAEVTGEIYWEASRLYRDIHEEDLDQWLNSSEETWTPELDAIIGRFLDRNAACLAALERATKREVCVLGGAVPEEFKDRALEAFRRFGFLLDRRMWWQAHRNLHEEACRSLEQIDQIQRHLRQAVGGLSARFVAAALESGASARLRMELPRMSESSIRSFEKRLDRHGVGVPGFEEALAVDFARTASWAQREFSSESSRWKAGEELAPQFLQGVASRVKTGLDSLGAEAVRMALSLQRDLPPSDAAAEFARYLQDFHTPNEQIIERISIAAAEAQRALRMESPVERQRGLDQACDRAAELIVRSVVHIGLGSLKPTFFKEARNSATRRATRLAVSLELYRRENGRYPETLQGLKLQESSDRTDPFSRQPFRYRLHDETGYQLWSVGRNGIDDRGSGHTHEGPNDPRVDLVFDGPRRGS